MKKSLQFSMLALLLGMLFLQPALAQEESVFDEIDPSNPQSLIAAGFGLQNVGGQTMIGLRLQPEFAIGKFGAGLDVPLMYNIDEGSLRLDEYYGGVGALRLIRYLSWGVKKRDPFFIRVGDLTGSYIGYGMLLNNYTNSISYEKRTLGVSMDMLIKKKFGLEVLYSNLNLSSFNLLAVRPYYRPLGDTDIPILRTLEIGATYITDHDNTKTKLNDSVDVLSNQFVKDGVNAFGADMGVHLINNRMFRLTGFMQYGALLKNTSQLLEDSVQAYIQSGAVNSSDSSLIAGYDMGSGFSVGLEAKAQFMGLFQLSARLERLWYTDYFAPQFFDAYYEMSKDNKIFGLTSARDTRGIYGSLTASLIDKVSLTGALLYPKNIGSETPGLVKLNLDASQLIPKFTIIGSYYKGGLKAFSINEVFRFDERSLARMLVAYQVYKFLEVGMDYRWVWAQDENGAFKVQNHFSPYFGMRLPLGEKKDSPIIDEDF